MRRFSFVGTLAVVLTLALSMIWLGLTLIGRSFVDDGESDIAVEHLQAEVTLVRDGYGVPYIVAANEDDAWFGIGYAHAQDRLWQMDLMRRAGEGRLSEIFGRRALDYDRLLRTVGFARIARRIEQGLPQQTRKALQSYSNGVNACISAQKGRFPFEFDALGYEPEEWTPLHSILVVRMLGWELNLSMWTDIVYHEIADRVDSIRFAEIVPHYPTDAPTIIPGGQRPETGGWGSSDNDTVRRDTSRSIGRAGMPHAPQVLASVPHALLRIVDLDRAARELIGIAGPQVGSNAWALAPGRSLSGGAMLASDPHLPHSAPCRWYQCVLMFPGTHLAGVTLPGIPFIVSGRNDSVAWGLTAMMADQTDFYVEAVDTIRRTAVLHDGAWETMTTIRDTINVRDSASVPMVVRTTRHGPVLSDVDPWVGIRQTSDPGWRSRKDTLVAMRWAGSNVTQELAALHGMNRASNLTTFTAATRLGGVPAMSIAYADARGTIAFVPSALIPIRATPLLPRPGWDSRYNWKGTLPLDRIPTHSNPASGYVACANNKVSNMLPFSVGDFWEDPSRATRLQELLREGEGIGVTDFIQIQADVVSPYMRYLVDYLLRAFPDSSRQGSAVQAALTVLRSWDGGMRDNGAEAAIAAVWLQTVVTMTYQDEMGDELFRRWAYLAQNPIRALRYHCAIDSRWFDNTRTSGRREQRDDILREALGIALDTLHRRLNTWDVRRWRYGDIHSVTFPHPFGDRPDIRSIVNVGPFEVGGANGTINSGEWDFTRPYTVRVGPTMRQIIDFSDTSVFVRSVVTTGASGQPLNEFYSNQTVLWLSNGYIALRRSPPLGTDVFAVTRLHPATSR